MESGTTESDLAWVAHKCMVAPLPGVLGHPSHHQRGSRRNAGQLGSAPDGPSADQLSSQEEQCGGHDDHRNNHPTEQQMPDASTVVGGRSSSSRLGRS